MLLMLRYAITDGTAANVRPAERIPALRALVQRWATAGIDFIQLREKNLATSELFVLAGALVDEARSAGSRTRLLVNTRADIALGSGAGGVHLTGGADQMTPAQVRSVFQRAGRPSPVVSVSCHTVEDLRRASREGADLLLFGPVFGKTVQGDMVVEGSGLDRLREAVAAAGELPVLALGGVTEANSLACREVGAAGVAGIRLFG